ATRVGGRGGTRAGRHGAPPRPGGATPPGAVTDGSGAARAPRRRARRTAPALTWAEHDRPPNHLLGSRDDARGTRRRPLAHRSGAPPPRRAPPARRARSRDRGFRRGLDLARPPRPPRPLLPAPPLTR